MRLVCCTEFVTESDKQSGMIILESILTNIFLGSWGSIENWLVPKIKPP
jgi:hypothetical protein